jgi:hypothetical protein
MLLVGWAKTIHMTINRTFLHEPRVQDKNIDNEVYYVCIEFPNLIVLAMVKGRGLTASDTQWVMTYFPEGYIY